MGRSSGMTGDDAYAILHKKIGSGGGEGGTSDYNALANKPKLNGVELSGNKTSADYKIVSSEQGAENNGKFLGIGADGNVTPVDKPTYTANEVGARPNTWMPSAEDIGALSDDTEIPTKTSDLTNDSGFITNEDIPEKLPNPQKIIFTGAVSAEYDGSSQQTINIPTGGGTGGTTDYNGLLNKPKINNVEVSGDKTSDDYGVVSKGQGVDNAGKMLGVGKDGNVELQGPLTQDVEVTAPSYTNKIPVSVDTTGAIYNQNGIKSGYALNSSGAEVSSGTTCITGFIPVSKGDIIRVQDPGQSSFDTTLMFVLYKELVESSANIGKTVVNISENAIYGTLSIDGDTVTWDTSGIGYYFWDNFTYLRVTVHSANSIVTVNEEITSTTKIEKHLVPDVKVSKQNLTFNPSLPILAGKKVVVFGDSIIGMTRDDTSVTAYLSKYTGATVYNVGFGGCRMSVHPTNGYAAFSMWALADAITSGNYTTQDAQVSSGEDYFSEQLSTLKGINFEDVDYIVIHYGTNDFGGNVTIDNEGDTDSTSTLCGALRYSLNKIITTYPNAKLFVSVPLFRIWDEQNSDTYENTNGNKLTDFVAALKDVASEYHLPIIDGYNALGINSINNKYFLSDGTHLSEPGRKIFGEFIGGKLIGQD